MNLLLPCCAVALATAFATVSVASSVCPVCFSKGLTSTQQAGIHFGSPANSFLFLASADVKGFHYDANAFVRD